MDKKSIHEWARIFAGQGLVAICDVDRLYGKMLRKTQASGLWESAETELRLNREVRIFSENEARDVAEACLPIKQQTPKILTPCTIKQAVCGKKDDDQKALKRI